jgi:histidine ammonia-lyase
MGYNRTTRRDFVRKAALSMVGTVSFPYIIPSVSLGGEGKVAPSDRITLGLIGTGNINRHHRDQQRRASWAEFSDSAGTKGL